MFFLKKSRQAKASQKSKPSVLVIVGPTASGKSALAVEIAKKIKGEVISADSRQVYRGLDVASGKITPDEMQGIPHHLLDISNIENRYTVMDYRSDCYKAITEILERRQIPIICGGSGYYISTVVDNLDYPSADKEIEKEINDLDAKALKTKAAQTLSQAEQEKLDMNNPARLRRALALKLTHSSIPPVKRLSALYDFIIYGIKIEKNELLENIKKRTDERLQNGMIEEVEDLLDQDITPERLLEIGLEYRILTDYILNPYPLADLREKIIKADYQYARRQKKWFQRDPRIIWAEKEEILAKF